MKKLGGTLIFSGVVMLIGPLFGFTLRSAQDLDYGSGAMFGLILLVVGIIFISIKKEN